MSRKKQSPPKDASQWDLHHFHLDHCEQYHYQTLKAFALHNNIPTSDSRAVLCKNIKDLLLNQSNNMQEELSLIQEESEMFTTSNPSIQLFYEEIGGGMNFDDLPMKSSGKVDIKQLDHVRDVVAGWERYYGTDRRRSGVTRLTLIPNYNVKDVTYDAVGVPMRLVLARIDLTYPKWLKRRSELLNIAIAHQENGHQFGVHVATSHKKKQRLAIGVTIEALKGIVPGNNNLDDEIQRNILPFLRNIQNTPMCLIKASIFIDPPGSSPQKFHMDIEKYDRNQLWNLFLPIQTPPGVPTAIMERDHITGAIRSTQSDSDAVMWDGNWKHKGVGNPSTNSIDRVMLHLVYAPVWMIMSGPGQKAIAVEYNNNKSVLDPYTDVGYWLTRYWDRPNKKRMNCDTRVLIQP